MPSPSPLRPHEASVRSAAGRDAVSTVPKAAPPLTVRAAVHASPSSAGRCERGIGPASRAIWCSLSAMRLSSPGMSVAVLANSTFACCNAVSEVSPPSKRRRACRTPPCGFGACAHDAQLLIERHQFIIGGRHFGHERHLQRALRIDRSQVLGHGLPVGPAQIAPQVELPRQRDLGVEFGVVRCRPPS